MDQQDAVGISEAAEAADAAGWQRAAVRESTLLMATVQIEGEPGPAITLRIRNLSAGGLMGECDRHFTQGERTEVDLRNIGPVGGTVAWVAGGRIGIAFDRAIDPKATRRAVGAGVGTSTILVSPCGRRPGLR